MIELRPSGSAIWTKCPASARFALNCAEEPESDAAREGTAAAWVAETVLNGNAIFAEDLKGETHPNGWLITPDMCDYVQGYIELIRSRGGVMSAERFVRLNEFIGGTLDSTSTVMGDTLFVDDLKYGYGIVEPDTPQLIIYGAARLQELLNDGVPVSKVQLGIYQPRAFHDDGIYRTRTITIQQIHDEAAEVIQAGQLCQDPNSLAIPGQHCKHCVARASCEALTHTVYEIFDVLQSPRQLETTMGELANELGFLEIAAALVDARKTAVEAEAEQQVRAGKHLPGWHLKDRKARRKLKVGPETVRAITGIDPYKQVLRSPAELEKAGASVKAVKALSETPIIGQKLERLPADYFDKTFNKGSKQ